MPTWQCIHSCGACCRLAPEERPDVADYLAPAEYAQYLLMAGADGWCIYFDHISKGCTIYETRPQFCRVLPETFQAMYGITAAELNDFAIECCYDQIESVYGEDSMEMLRFEETIYAAELAEQGLV
ncbi:MAG: YkgJ family cysteine cluster protein [Pseudanabaena sp. ELA607]